MWLRSYARRNGPQQLDPYCRQSSSNRKMSAHRTQGGAAPVPCRVGHSPPSTCSWCCAGAPRTHLALCAAAHTADSCLICHQPRPPDLFLCGCFPASHPPVCMCKFRCFITEVVEMEVEAQEGEMLWYYNTQRAHWEARDASSFLPQVAVFQDFIILNSWLFFMASIGRNRKMMGKDECWVALQVPEFHSAPDSWFCSQCSRKGFIWEDLFLSCEKKFSLKAVAVKETPVTCFLVFRM